MGDSRVRPGRLLPDILASLGEQLREFEMQKPVVYFLTKNREGYGPQILYVGSTIDLANRLKHHSSRKDFDRVFFIELSSSEDLIKMEFALIRALSPPLNVVGRRGDGPSLWDSDYKSVLRDFGFRVYEIEESCNERKKAE